MSSPTGRSAEKVGDPAATRLDRRVSARQDPGIPQAMVGTYPPSGPGIPATAGRFTALDSGELTGSPPPEGGPGTFSTVAVVAEHWLTDEQQRTWRAWLTVAELLPRVLDAQLQRDAGISHAAYVVLAMLSESPQRSRRMSDLARRANQSQSRLSHTVARLEERGWVRRERSAEDGRGNVAVLTDAGWGIVRKVAPGHVDAVREAMFAPLDPVQARALGEALEAVQERLDPDRSLRVQQGADTGA